MELPRSIHPSDDAISPDRLKRETAIEFIRVPGPGGQKKNKTMSGVRLTHLPTGIVVTATERRSQHQNRAAAFERLRARLIAHFAVPTPRYATRPTYGSRLDRRREKQRRSEKKRERRSLE